MIVLLPPAPNFALPGSDRARQLGCTCPATEGSGLPGLTVPAQTVDERPRFGAAKEYWYFYDSNCVLHGAVTRKAIEEMDERDQAVI